MGATLLAPCLKQQDLQAAVETDEIHPDIMQWIESTALQDIVRGLHMRIHKRSAGAVRLSAGIYIPLTDEWTYTEGEMKISPRKGQYEVLCCTADEGIFTLTSDGRLVSFTKPPPASPVVYESMVYRIPPTGMECWTFDDQKMSISLKRLLPNASEYLWSRIDKLSTVGKEGMSFRLPSRAPHLFFVYADKPDSRGPNKVVLRTSHMNYPATSRTSWTLETCEAVHIPNPHREYTCSYAYSGYGKLCASVAYMYAWLPTEGERSSMEDFLTSCRYPPRLDD